MPAYYVQLLLFFCFLLYNIINNTYFCTEGTLLITFQGTGASFGVADGTLFLVTSKEKEPKRYEVNNPMDEWKRANDAIEKAKSELFAMHSEALSRGADEDAANVFDIQAMMLSDADFLATIKALIETDKLCAEYAVHKTSISFSEQLKMIDDDYMQKRADDVLDASKRVCDILTRSQSDMLRHVKTRVVLAVDTLLPSHVMLLDRSKVCAFVAKRGSAGCHAAILARSMGLPVVCALGDNFDKLIPDMRTLVDGDTGSVVQSPDVHTVSEFAAKMLNQVKAEHALGSVRGLPCVTLSGTVISLEANISAPAEAKKAVAAGAQGIGLFRSELLYLTSPDAVPSEDSLYEAYRDALLAANKQHVYIRLLDADENKHLFYPDTGYEENPSLGMHAVALAEKHPDVLLTQLRAMMRASVYGELGILVPMVTSVDEIRFIKEYINTAHAQLVKENYAVASNLMLGIIIETPAAAIMTDVLAPEVDFITIGTNDLTQYMLAADRQSAAMNEAYASPNAAVLRMTAHAVAAAKEAGVPVSVCGEYASMPELAGYFAHIGVDALSMSASKISAVKKAIRALDARMCKEDYERLIKGSILTKF